MNLQNGSSWLACDSLFLCKCCSRSRAAQTFQTYLLEGDKSMCQLMQNSKGLSDHQDMENFTKSAMHMSKCIHTDLCVSVYKCRRKHEYLCIRTNMLCFWPHLRFPYLCHFRIPSLQVSVLPGFSGCSDAQMLKSWNTGFLQWKPGIWKQPSHPEICIFP